MSLRNMRCVFSLLCVLHAASASFAPNVHARVRPTAVRSHALRMAEKVKEPPPTIVPAAVAGETNVLAEVPFPSLYAIAYTAIVGLTLKDLAANVAIVSWIANGAALSDFPYTSFSGGVVLIAYMSYQLARMAGVGKVDHYSEGLESEGAAVNSLASQAAAWALAGEVPLRSADGTYEVATFAGGCFWGTPPSESRPNCPNCPDCRRVLLGDGAALPTAARGDPDVRRVHAGSHGAAELCRGELRPHWAYRGSDAHI